MRKILLLSDTHSYIDDHVARVEFPEFNRFTCEQVDVLITHIGGYPPKYNNRTRDIVRAERPKLFICGHSHILKVMPDKALNVLHMNPGAVGKHGFHKVRTMLKFTIDGANIKDLQVIEFENRY